MSSKKTLNTSSTGPSSSGLNSSPTTPKETRTHFLSHKKWRNFHSYVSTFVEVTSSTDLASVWMNLSSRESLWIANRLLIVCRWYSQLSFLTLWTMKPHSLSLFRWMRSKWKMMSFCCLIHTSWWRSGTVRLARAGRKLITIRWRSTSTSPSCLIHPKSILTLWWNSDFQWPITIKLSPITQKSAIWNPAWTPRKEWDSSTKTWSPTTLIWGPLHSTWSKLWWTKGE